MKKLLSITAVNAVLLFFNSSLYVQTKGKTKTQSIIYPHLFNAVDGE